MGDIHVHTAPHSFEEHGYEVWCWGDSLFVAIYTMLAAAVGAVAAFMIRRRKVCPWRSCRGGEDWWKKKFLFMVLWTPFTVIRAWNLYVWAAFNCGAGLEGDQDKAWENSLKTQGDWFNAVCFWYLLVMKSLFLLSWMEIQRTQGNVRWRAVYVQLLVAMVVLCICLGIPQTLAVYYGGICETQRENDYCRKYHDVTSMNAVVQALAGIGFGISFGLMTWHWNSDSQYEPLGSAHRLSTQHRESYGSAGRESGSARDSGGMVCAFDDADAEVQIQDARKYSGVAYSIFFSLIAHSAFNVYFSWYAVGGLGLSGNSSLMTLTMIKMVAVEIAPIVWISITIWADAASAEPRGEDANMSSNGGTSQRMGLMSGSRGGVDEDDTPPPASAYQIE